MQTFAIIYQNESRFLALTSLEGTFQTLRIVRDTIRIKGELVRDTLWRM